jgi:hypothetical protein
VAPPDAGADRRVDTLAGCDVSVDNVGAKPATEERVWLALGMERGEIALG